MIFSSKLAVYVIGQQKPEPVFLSHLIYVKVFFYSIVTLHTAQSVFCELKLELRCCQLYMAKSSMLSPTLPFFLPVSVALLVVSIAALPDIGQTMMLVLNGLGDKTWRFPADLWALIRD